MSVLWTHTDAAAATGGRAVGQWSVSGLSIDTRSLEEGQLFVPLKDIRDGHDFIPLAFEKGAAAVISEHEVQQAPALIVLDSLKALEDLAIAARKRSTATRIAVTGSVGKTSVKEMIAAICREAGNTHASIKSFNNHWGVPLTLAGMPQDTQYGVFEMGMNHAGELAELTKIVRPDIAVITKIAPAHLAHFKSVEAIASAKAEILSGLTENGVAILPRDSEYYDSLAERIGRTGRVSSFGWHAQADACIIETHLTTRGSRSVIRIADQDFEVELPLPGKHWVENAACALLATYHVGVRLDASIKVLKNMHKIQGRGETHALSIRGQKINLIDESYNANPESMAASIAVLGLSKGRKIAVLGDMLELGDKEASLHVQLLGPLRNAKIDQVITCGEHMKNLHNVLPKSMSAGWFPDHEKCLAGLLNQVQDGDVIMVKGSNASGMGKLVAGLKLVSGLKSHNNNKGYANAI
ncbi:UDP-N-acetylmuramoyl-tripeptide--D-alanyl-D-alanine ligase [bacterium AH-315-J23]|nr:UDP-N-acetylmuramoyl-tripeptide--D-alanyl-D-alanine ligase [bacterium AH-315-J23]